MANLKDITAEEAVWLIQAVFNTSHHIGKPIDFAEFTPELVSKEIGEMRATNALYDNLKIKLNLSAKT